MVSQELLGGNTQISSATNTFLHPDNINTGITLENKALSFKDQIQMLDPHLVALEGALAGILILSLSGRPKLAAIGVQLFLAAALATTELVDLTTNGYENALVAIYSPLAAIGIAIGIKNFIQSLSSHD